VHAALPREVTFKRLEHRGFRYCAVANPPPGSGFPGKLVKCLKYGLMPGLEAKVDIVVRVPNDLSAGTRLPYSVIADPHHWLTERNEGNNIDSTTTTILGPQCDLVIDSSSVDKQDAPAFNDVNDTYTQVQLRMVIRNAGPLPSPATTVRVDWPSNFCGADCFCPLGAVYDLAQQDCVFLSPAPGDCTFNSVHQTSTCPVPVIEADHTATLTVTAYRPRPFFAENAQVTAKLDPNNQVAETLEGNNGLSRTFSVP
jgi:hypothetical protein